MAEQAKQETRYPYMQQYLRLLKDPGKRKMVGRKDIIDLILATLNRHEISNVALVGEAGTGKTTVVYGAARLDRQRYYYEVRLSLMTASENGSDGAVQMASRLTNLIDEVIAWQQETGKQLVLFMDEFHLIMEISPAAMEAIKPILANSGAQGVKLIVATTLEEYNQFVRPNEALNERLERITLPELNFDETLTALKGSVQAYLPNEPVDERLLRKIIESTNQALPSQVQPRKSLRVLDSMIGWHDTFHDPMSVPLLAKMMKASVGVDIDYQVDVEHTRELMEKRVFGQPTAIDALLSRIYVSVADLNDTSRPRGSFLFAGPTGVGKTELAKTLAHILFGSDSAMIRFDMSEYANKGDTALLKDSLTEKVWERPSSVILFDEIEKADPSAAKLLLQVLDDARMTDEHGREVSFKDTYIILTTNEADDIFSSMYNLYNKNIRNKDRDPEKFRAEQKKLIDENMTFIESNLSSNDNQFPSELLGRFDRIVPFLGLDLDTRYLVCERQLQELTNKVFQKHGVTLHIDDRVERYLVEEHAGSNETSKGGARYINRRIQSDVVDKVSEVLLRYPELNDLGVVVNGDMAVDMANDIKGNASIAVGQWSQSKRRKRA